MAESLLLLESGALLLREDGVTSLLLEFSLHDYVWRLTPGGYTLTGMPMASARTRALMLEPGVYAVVGQPVSLVRQRDESGWGASLHPANCGGRQALDPATHPGSPAGGLLADPLHPVVQAPRAGLSDAVHPRGKPATPLPLESCK